MFTQKMKVTYQDGHEETVVATQADVKAFELWALQRGIYARKGGSLLTDAPILFMRAAAWAATCRATGHRVEYELWDNTVEEVLPDEEVDVDPFDETTQGGESPS